MNWMVLTRWLAMGLLGLALLFAGSLAYRAVLSRRHAPQLGLVMGRLKPCGPKPNCVCSQDADPGHAIEPLAFKGTKGDAMARLRKVLAAQPRTVITRETDDYLHVECRSALFGFVDDVEFLVDESAHLIHVRSASRQGYSDLGVNRKRVEALRKEFNQG